MEDMVDLIVNSEELKKYLIFENNNQANTVYYEALVRGLNERSKRHIPKSPNVSVSQARNNFKKLVKECKELSLTVKHASGIDQHRVEKGYGRWWHKLYELVSSRPSSNPNNNVEPSFEENAEDDVVDASTQTPSKKKAVPQRPTSATVTKQGLQKTLIQCLEKIAKDDSIDRIMAMYERENERERKFQLELFDRMNARPNQTQPQPHTPYPYPRYQSYDQLNIQSVDGNLQSSFGATPRPDMLSPMYHQNMPYQLNRNTFHAVVTTTVPSSDKFYTTSQSYNYSGTPLPISPVYSHPETSHASYLL